MAFFVDQSYVIPYHISKRDAGGLMMTTLTATEARANLYRLLDQVALSHEPVLITGKRGNDVLLSEDDWRAI